MSDTFMRHLIAFIAMLVVGLGYLSGYISGGHGWWWTFLGLAVVYAAVLRLVDV